MAKTKVSLSVKQFVCPIYDYRVYAISGTENQVRAYLLRYFDSTLDEPNLEGDVGAHIILPQNKGSVIWIRDTRDFYTLLHETTHLVLRIFKQKGVLLDFTDDHEHFTYYLEFWFKNLWRFYANK